MGNNYLKILLPLFFLLTVSAFAQQQTVNNPFFKLTRIYGEDRANGFYREQTYKTDYLKDVNGTTFYSGGILLRSSNYVWNPNFLILDAEIEYNPEFNQEKFLVIPDRAEQRTIGKAGIKGTFFQNKIVNLIGYVNYNQSYLNRGNFTNIKSENQQYGGQFSFRHKVLPTIISYNHTDWKQQEIATGRQFKINQDNLQGKISKSITSRDKNEFIYTHDEFLRKDALTAALKNKIDNFELRDDIALDKNKKYNFMSNLNKYYQVGIDTLERFIANEHLSLDLPQRFMFTANYNFNDVVRPNVKMIQNNVKGMLRKKIYESVNTGVSYEWSDMNHTAYHETVNKLGFDLNYTKKLGKHRLNLFYRYQMHQNNMVKTQVDMQIYNEEHVLTDGQIVLLHQPNVVLSSVKVKDFSNTFYYLENYDYIVIKHTSYVEIQRLPGGQIPNNTQIKVDYVSTNPGSYAYNLDNNSFGASMLLFNNVIEIYYRGAIQSYRNLENTEFITLNYFNQNVAGLRLNYGFASGGVEFDNYDSKIVPYRLVRYYATLQKEFFNKLSTTLNANYSDYYLLDNESNQVFADVSGKVSYQIASHSKLGFDFGYRNQSGKEINLDLLTAGIEYGLTYRQIQVNLGLEMYQRNYIKEELGMKGAYFKLVRKFNYESPAEKMNRLEKSNLELGIR